MFTYKGRITFVSSETEGSVQMINFLNQSSTFSPLSCCFCSLKSLRKLYKFKHKRTKKHPDFHMSVFFMCSSESSNYFYSPTPKGKFLSKQRHSTQLLLWKGLVSGRLGAFTVKGGELTDRLTHAERERERETESVTVWLLAALYMLLIPGRAAL